ncbi:MAG: transposase [Daejeonella sp.]
MYTGIEFFTATCLNWQHLLADSRHKEIIINSLKYLVKDGRIDLYGFVIMPNHIHLLWCKKEKWLGKNVQQHFLKYTAQQIKFNLLANYPEELINYKSTQRDREFWERRPFKATMNRRIVLEQKLDYIHHNPVKAGLCVLPEDYLYSSAAYYFTGADQWRMLTHYMEHI